MHLRCLAHTQAQYFKSTPVSDDTSTPGSDDTSTPGSNYLSIAKCASNCTFTLMYMVVLPGVDVLNLKEIYMAQQVQMSFSGPSL